MNVNDRSLCVENANWCPIHILHTDSLQEYNMKIEARFECGIDNCKKHHHKSLHGATTPFLATINSTAANQHVQSKSSTNSDSVLFALQSVPSSEGHLNTLLDDSAKYCLITKHIAQSLNLIGEPITMNISTEIGSNSIPSRTYQAPLIYESNAQHIISAFEVDSISDSIASKCHLYHFP